MMCAMLFNEYIISDSPFFIAGTFLGGWAGSTLLIRRGARSITRTVSRGFLIGAAEWLAMIAVGLAWISTDHESPNRARPFDAYTE
jgi:hypothetical protein